MKKEDYPKLSAALVEAQFAAMNFADVSDEGTCNLDTVIVKLPRADKKKLAEMPVRLSRYDGSFYYVWFEIHGQASRRTTMCEAAKKSLRASGYTAYVHYCMD